MQAAVFTSFDGPAAIEVREMADPDPDEDEVVLRVEACSLNRHDLKILSEGIGIGIEEPPFVAGVDVAGVVEATGAAVEDVEPGDRVVRCPNRTCGRCRFCREGPENRCEQYSLDHGGLAERALARADRLIEIPDDLGFAGAASLPVGYLTAYHMMRRTEVSQGDLVFVPGAAGSVGVAAVGLLDAIGARSVVTSTSRAKLDRLVEIGADHAIESGDPDEIRAAVEEIGAVDAVLNHLSGPFTQVGLDVLRRDGTMAICGQTAGSEVTIDILPMYLEHKSVVGSTCGTQGDLRRAVELISTGDLDPVVGDRYQLEGTAEAFRDLRDRESFGSLIVEP
jgi:NADPH2:quinone reductase